MIKNYPLSRADKILLSLYRLSNGTKKKIRFEDIAVTAFKHYPEDFQLKGYPQYPDTGDIIHKPLYSELKKKGCVLSGNKYFSLTNKGLERSQFLNSRSSHSTSGIKHEAAKFTASQRYEIENILGSTAYSLFTQRKREDILDIDFYNYLGVTVRTNKYDFMGRLNAVEDSIAALGLKKPELGSSLKELHNYLMEKFDQNVTYFVNRKGGKG